MEVYIAMEWNVVLICVVVSIVVPIIAGLLAWGISVLKKLVNEKIDNATLKAVLNDGLTVIENSVKYTYQTYVEGMKDKDIFDEAAQKQALQMAKDKALSMLSEGFINMIKDMYGDVNNWLETNIESTIYTLKNSNKTVDKVTE